MNSTIRLCVFLCVFFLPVAGCGSQDSADDGSVQFSVLLDNQSKFRGKTITVSGYLKRDYEIEGKPLSGFVLYDDQLSSDIKKSISLVFKKEQKEDVGNFIDEKVYVSGYFVSGAGISPVLSSASITKYEPPKVY